jgi:hypothetical protein
VLDCNQAGFQRERGGVSGLTHGGCSCHIRAGAAAMLGLVWLPC